MNRIRLIIVFAGVCITCTCGVQSGSSQPITNWGVSVSGVQLAISLSNNIVVPDSTITLQYAVKNSSTNLISWWVINSTQGFNLILLDHSGGVNLLTPPKDTNSPVKILSYVTSFKVKAGETYKGSIPIVLSAGIKTGNYHLRAKQYFHFAGRRQDIELLSNLLEVNVK